MEKIDSNIPNWSDVFAGKLECALVTTSDHKVVEVWTDRAWYVYDENKRAYVRRKLVK